MFRKVRVQITLESTVFVLTLAVLENHEIFSSYNIIICNQHIGNIKLGPSVAQSYKRRPPTTEVTCSSTVASI